MRIPPINVSPPKTIPAETVGTTKPADRDRPDNQPVSRWRGQIDVPLPATDPLPPWLAHPFKKHGIIMEPDPSVPWKAKDVFNPTAIIKDGQVHLFPRCEDNTGSGDWHGTSRIGHYISDDGIHFLPARDPDVPMLEPTEPYEKPGGCEDPRIVQLDTGKYVLTYTAFDGQTARLCLAASDDLVHWKKTWPIFPDDLLVKSPGIKRSEGTSIRAQSRCSPSARAISIRGCVNPARLRG